MGWEGLGSVRVSDPRSPRSATTHFPPPTLVPLHLQTLSELVAKLMAPQPLEDAKARETLLDGAETLAGAIDRLVSAGAIDRSVSAAGQQRLSTPLVKMRLSHLLRALHQMLTDISHRHK